jgi:hypothetical protein
MLSLIVLLAAGSAGCRTAEVAVNYPLAGVYIVAKFEGKEEPAPISVAPPALLATEWNATARR